jgi:hypothetical protein
LRRCGQTNFIASNKKSMKTTIDVPKVRKLISNGESDAINGFIIIGPYVQWGAVGDSNLAQQP